MLQGEVIVAEREDDGTMISINVKALFGYMKRWWGDKIWFQRVFFITSFIVLDTLVGSSLCLFEDGGKIKEANDAKFVHACVTMCQFYPFWVFVPLILCVLFLGGIPTFNPICLPLFFRFSFFPCMCLFQTFELCKILKATRMRVQRGQPKY